MANEVDMLVLINLQGQNNRGLYQIMGRTRIVTNLWHHRVFVRFLALLKWRQPKRMEHFQLNFKRAAHNQVALHAPTGAEQSTAGTQSAHLQQLPVDCSRHLPLQGLPCLEEAAVQPHITPAAGCEHVAYVVRVPAVCVH